MKYLISLFLTFFLIPSSFCQVIDSLYIDSYSEKMMITLSTSRKSIQLTQSDIGYKPNVPLGFGVGVSVRNTIIDLEVGYGVSIDGKEKTKIIDFQTHNYGRKLLLDLAFQKYKGFYQDEIQDVFLPKYSVTQVGAEGTYLFNGNKFSAKAAFLQSEKQLKSVGSFLLGGGIYFHEIHRENDSISFNQNIINNYQIGLTTGYAYSWVINKYWLLSTMATAGMSMGNKFDLIKTGNFSFFPTLYSRSSIGYHKADWGLSFSMLIHNKSLKYFDNNDITITSLNMQISYIKNLDKLF